MNVIGDRIQIVSAIGQGSTVSSAVNVGYHNGDSALSQWGWTNSENPDGAASQVGSFPVQWQYGFRTLARQVLFYSVFLILNHPFDG